MSRPSFTVAYSRIVPKERVDELKRLCRVEKDSDLLKVLIDVFPSMNTLDTIADCKELNINQRFWAKAVKAIITGVMEEIE